MEGALALRETCVTNGGNFLEFSPVVTLFISVAMAMAELG
jgi:hypothetical protein